MLIILIHRLSNLEYCGEDSEGEPEDEDTGDEDRDRFDEADEDGDGVVDFAGVLSCELVADFVDGGGALSGSDDLDEVLGEYLEIWIGFLDTLGEAATVLDFLGNLIDFRLEESIVTGLSGEFEGLDNRDSGLEEEWKGRSNAHNRVVAVHGPDDRESEVEWVESVATEGATRIGLEEENRDDNDNNNGNEVIFDESARSYECLSDERELYSGALEERFKFGDDVGHDYENRSNEKDDDDERVGECSFYLGLEFLLIAELESETLERTLHRPGLFSGFDDGDFSSVENTRELLHRDTETISRLHEDEEIHDLCLEARIFILVEERPEGCDNRYASIDHIGEMLVEKGFFFWSDFVPKSNLFRIYLIVHSDE